MSIFGPGFNPSFEPDQDHGVDQETIQQIRNALWEKVSRAGDVMIGQLNMAGNHIRGLPTAYPPENYRGDEAASWGQVVNMVLDSQNGALRLDGSSIMAGNLHMEGHGIKDVGKPMAPLDAVNRAYVDDGVRSRPYFLKLKCGESSERKIAFRDFFIPNRHKRFGLEKGRIFLSYSLRHGSGPSTPCTIVRLGVDSNFLKIRFALVSPWTGKLNLYTRVDVLSPDVNVEHSEYKVSTTGQLVEWE